jgi:hypothetical protein
MHILREYVGENLQENFNYYLYNGIVEIHFYREVMKNETMWSLFSNKDNIEMWTGEWISIVENAIREVTENFNKDFGDDEIHAAALMIIGARLSIFNEFSNKRNMSADECCYHFVYLAGVLSRLDEATIRRNIERAFEFADSHEFPKIPLFDRDG